MKFDELKVYVPLDGPYGLESVEGGELVEEETCYLKSDVDAVIAELKQKLRDAVMWVAKADDENCRLKRALWIARATIAHNAIYKYQRLACKAEMDPQPHGWSCYINGEVYRTGKMNRMLEPHYWTVIWENVECKCLKKAEEYK